MSIKNLKWTNEDIFTLILIVCTVIVFGYFGYNNFKDHRNIFPKGDNKEYVYRCPKCNYISKGTHKWCPSCHKCIFYNQIKVEVK